MNGWQCEEPGCPYKCVGVNGAMGLLAIGWYFRPFGMDTSGRIQLFCPLHRPDMDLEDAKKESQEIQNFIYEKFGIENPYKEK